MISPVLKDFIEHNSELLENNLRKFLDKALVRLRGKAFEELICMLEDAQIEFDTHRTQMLINKLGFIFADTEDKTRLEDIIKYDIMCKDCLTFFGLTFTELIQFIFENELSWKYDIYLEQNVYGEVVVRSI